MLLIGQAHKQRRLNSVFGFEGSNFLRNNAFGPVAQLVRAPPCHGGGHEFESRLGRLHSNCKRSCGCDRTAVSNGLTDAITHSITTPDSQMLRITLITFVILMHPKFHMSAFMQACASNEIRLRCAHYSGS